MQSGVSDSLVELFVNTIPDKTLKAFADSGAVGDPLPTDGGDSARDAYEAAGFDVAALGAKLQVVGTASLVASWHELLGVIEQKSGTVRSACSTSHK